MKIDKFFSYFLAITLILTLLYISKNLNQKSLWYDEAGQFFIAKGLNHDSEPFAKERSLKEVIENNANYNLDPGGFSILLHFWTKVSNSHIWLRLLPFIFFLGFIFSWIYLFYVWSGSLNIALLSGFIPIISRSAYIVLGFEIRAYSMEYLGTILCIIALLNLKSRITKRRILIWSCIFSFFITSRYSEVIVVFIASLIIIYFIYTSEISLKQKLFSFFLYATPLLVTVLYIILAAQIHQNKNMIELDYVLYISRDFKKLATMSNLFFLVTLLGFIVLFVFRNKYTYIKKYEIILFFTISVNLTFIILSILGAYPWMPFDQRSISFFLLMNVCLMAFVLEFICNFSSKIGSVKYYIIASALVSILFLKKQTFFSREGLREDYYKVLTTIDLKKFKKIFVESRSSSPSIRYLFEYGALKYHKNMGYPNKFTFGKFIRHNIVKGGESEKEFFAHQPKMNTYLEYDMFIAQELCKYGDNDKWVLLKNTKGFFVKKKQ